MSGLTFRSAGTVISQSTTDVLIRTEEGIYPATARASPHALATSPGLSFSPWTATDVPDARPFRITSVCTPR